MVIANASVAMNTMTADDIRIANDQGKTTEALYWKQIHNQAIVAFKTGRTEQLLSMYRSVAENGPDATTRELAANIIEEILGLEQNYITAQDYVDSHTVMAILSNDRLSDKDLDSTGRMLSEEKEKLITKLDSIKGKNNYKAEYSLLDD